MKFGIVNSIVRRGNFVNFVWNGNYSRSHDCLSRLRLDECQEQRGEEEKRGRRNNFRQISRRFFYKLPRPARRFYSVPRAKRITRLCVAYARRKYRSLVIFIYV